MEDGLDEIRRAAFEHAAKSRTLDDIEKAASVAKSLADAQKSVLDTRNSNRQLRLQLVGSMSTFLVPIVSLLALLATIYVQSQQLSETRQQNNAQLEATRQQGEDSQWRDLLSSLRGTDVSFDSDVTVAPRLRSFFHSARYGDQAKDISIRLMGRLTNAGGFKELYGIAFAEITPDVFSKLLNVARSINSTRINIETECFNLSVQYKLSNQFGLCTLANSVNDLAKTINSGFPERALQLREATNDIYTEMEFVTRNIASYLKANFPNDTSSKGMNHEILDLSNLFIANVDLSNLNLSNANLENSVVARVNLQNSDLRFIRYSGIRFNASNWWDARDIDQGLLDFLIAYQYPHWNDVGFAFPLIEPTLEYYTARIARLCQPARPSCQPEKLQFRSSAKGS